MKASTKKRIWELLKRFAVFSVTSGAGTLVDLGVHWWLSAAFLQDRYWWTFWVAPVTTARKRAPASVAFRLREESVISHFVIPFFRFFYSPRATSLSPEERRYDAVIRQG